MKLRCAIIGCGNIAFHYEVNKAVVGIYTHADAYRACPQTELLAVCDANASALEKIHNAYPHLITFSTIDSLLDHGEWDIVSICTPDSTHASILLQLLTSGKVRSILTEKPLATSVADATRVVAAVCKHPIPILVNYSRRFDRKYQQLKTEITSGKWGEVQRAVFYYTGDILHNGSHALDILNYLWGKLTLDTTAITVPQLGTDRTLDLHGHFPNGSPFCLLGKPTGGYSIFEADIFCEKGSLHFQESGTQILQKTVAESRLVKGYQALYQHNILAGASDATYNAVCELVALLDGSCLQPTCSVEDALETLLLCEQIRERTL